MDPALLWIIAIGLIAIGVLTALASAADIVGSLAKIALLFAMLGVFATSYFVD